MINPTDQPTGMLKYTSRDYNSIMAEFWALVPKLTDLWKPESDADPGVVLGKFLASIADMLNVNIDWLANEIFAPSVTQRKNAEKLFSLIGYTLGWYTAARTEVTFTNNGTTTMQLDFGFNGANFATLNAYTDITQQPRVITYNILPLTNKYGAAESRSKRSATSASVNIFATADPISLAVGESVTRVAIEGELRNFTISVAQIKANNYIIKLPSQHLDTTAVWIKAKSSLHDDNYLQTQWVQVSSAAEFITPEPRFAVSYDNYSNAQIQVSNYLNQLENYDSNYLTIYWIECSGVIGSISSDVLSNFLPAKVNSGNYIYQSYEPDSLTISNLANTVELPHTYTVTGKSPESAKEAYRNSRNYINTNDSLITLPDFNRFLNREPGVDCGLVIDCQKALDINLAIYHDTSLTASQKSKMYITYNDFPAMGELMFDWKNILDLGFDPSDPQKFVFSANFKQYTAMCFAVHNDFQPSNYGPGRLAPAQIRNTTHFLQYKPPAAFLDGIAADFKPLQAMSVELGFGYARIFPWYVVGEIYPRNPVSIDVANTIIMKVKEALAIYFAPANRSFGQKPTIMEVVSVIESADSRIKYFDAGSLLHPVINWSEIQDIGTTKTNVQYDVEFFNPISFARYQDVGLAENNIRIAPDWLLRS